jgi:hypothetical protein
MVWKEDQTWSSRVAVSIAHSLIPLVLETQDEHFRLEMIDEIERRLVPPLDQFLKSLGDGSRKSYTHAPWVAL